MFLTVHFNGYYDIHGKKYQSFGYRRSSNAVDLFLSRGRAESNSNSDPDLCLGSTPVKSSIIQFD